MSEDLAALVIEQRGDTVVVRAVGEIDLSNAQTIRDELAAASDQGRALVLNLAGLSYLDSAGIAMIDLLHRALTREGIDFRIVAPSGAVVHRVLTLSSMVDIIPVHESEDAAILGISRA